jgi:hypothetical protein
MRLSSPSGNEQYVERVPAAIGEGRGQPCATSKLT